MKRIPRLMLVVFLGVLVLALPILIRGVTRYRALRDLGKVLDSPQALGRANMLPRKVSLDAPLSVNPINLGYAVFDVGPTRPLSIEASANSGAGVVLKNDQVQIMFLPPFAAGPAQQRPNAPSQGSGGSAAAARLQRVLADPLGADQDMEQTRPLPLLRVLWMGNEEFLVYSLNLSEKAGHRRGHNEVFFFTSPRARGIARVGDNAQDRMNASVSLSSLDGRRNVGFHVVLAAKSSQDTAALLNRILGSFQFTVDAVDNHEQIAKLIAEHGIRRKEDTQRASPAIGPGRDK
ncbi:MAG: hypothetical protein ACHRHE_06720 [Tepidisphaerales bacterium]